MSLVLRWRADRYVYHTGGVVYQWMDDVKGIPLSAPSVATRPNYLPSAYNNRPGVQCTGTQRMTYQGRLPFLEGLRGGTVYMLSAGGLYNGPYRGSSGFNQSGMIAYQLFNNQGDYNWGINGGNSIDSMQFFLRDSLNGGTTNAGITIPYLNNQISVKAATFDPAAANKGTLYSNGATKTQTLTGTLPNTTPKGWYSHQRPNNERWEFNLSALSFSGSYTLYGGTYYEIRYYDEIHNAQQQQSIKQQILTSWGLWNRTAVVCDGDSITAGSGSTGSLNGYPKQTQDALGTTGNYVIYNIGIPSQTVATILGKVANQVDAEAGSLGNRSVYVSQGGTNDLETVANATTTYNNIVSLCQGRQSAGYKVLVATILPRTSAGNASFETDRQTVNTNIRNNWATFADGLIDWGNDANIGQAGQQTNLTYYSGDNTHPNDTGYSVMAPYLINALALI